MKRLPVVAYVVIIVVAGLTGGLTGRLFYADNQPFKGILGAAERQSLYTTTDAKLLKHLTSTQFSPLGWADLLPPEERRLLKKYQTIPTVPMEEQFLTALVASQDRAYQSTMRSTAHVATLDGNAVTINGFIVPLEADSERKVLRFFLVPYFGACLHFPPPAPNQMVYVVSKGGFKMADINSAYSVSGILGNAMYEDPLGTAAYVMNAVTISRFNGQPDDLRNHQQYK
tara:strand:+ start:5620 stop:6303 length:684 start_codon:yes stop_codon:yes gene_type:complete